MEDSGDFIASAGDKGEIGAYVGLDSMDRVELPGNTNARLLKQLLRADNQTLKEGEGEERILAPSICRETQKGGTHVLERCSEKQHEMARVEEEF